MRPADGGQKHRVRFGRAGHVGVADRRPVRVIGRAADEALLDLEPGEALGLKMRDDLFDLGHDFGADAVAGKKEEMIGGHGELMSRRIAVGKMASVLDDFEAWGKRRRAGTSAA